MYLSYDECRAILDKKPANKELAVWVSDQAYHIYRIKKDLEELNQEEKILKSEFKVHLNKIKQRRCEIRERCRHFAVDAYNELSGTNKYGLCFTCGDLVEF